MESLQSFPINVMHLIIPTALGYFLGSIPFGLLLTRMAKLGDVRSIGSGNIGATNVLRTGRNKLAAMTLFLDTAKVTLAILIASKYFDRDAAALAGFSAFIGHIFLYGLTLKVAREWQPL